MEEVKGGTREGGKERGLTARGEGDPRRSKSMCVRHSKMKCNASGWKTGWQSKITLFVIHPAHGQGYGEGLNPSWCR